MIKEITNPANNGNGKLKPVVNSHYFSVRILVADGKSYNGVISYLREMAIKTEASDEDILRGKTNYIFDKNGKQVARTKHPEKNYRINKRSKRRNKK